MNFFLSYFFKIYSYFYFRKKKIIKFFFSEKEGLISLIVAAASLSRLSLFFQVSTIFSASFFFFLLLTKRFYWTRPASLCSRFDLLALFPYIYRFRSMTSYSSPISTSSQLLLLQIYYYIFSLLYSHLSVYYSYQFDLIIMEFPCYSYMKMNRGAAGLLKTKQKNFHQNSASVLFICCLILRNDGILHRRPQSRPSNITRII